MEPAVKPAAEATRSGVIGVLATSGTLESGKFAELVQRFGSQARVIVQPCPGLVEQVELGDLAGPLTRRLLEGFIAPLLDAGADTLVLGCTHFPFLQPLLRELVGGEVAVIETGAAVALHLSLPNPCTHREAARYAGHTWVSFCALAPTARRDALAHYMVHRLVEVHTADATATRQEEQARAQQAAAEAKRHG